MDKVSSRARRVKQSPELPPLRLAIYKGEQFRRFLEIPDPRTGIAHAFNSLNEDFGGGCRAVIDDDCKPSPNFELEGEFCILVDGEESHRGPFVACLMWQHSWFSGRKLDNIKIEIRRAKRCR